MPRLWTDTIDAHRAAVWDAIVEATLALVARNGLRSVTMSQVAKEAGIGRATLYKYFPDIESILTAWHERQLGGHLHQFAELAHRDGPPEERLRAVLEAYALIEYEHHGTELAALLHQGEHVAHARQQLTTFIERLLIEGGQAGKVRTDIPPGELAGYCLHALSAATGLPTEAAVQRLVTVTMTGLLPQG